MADITTSQSKPQCLLASKEKSSDAQDATSQDYRQQSEKTKLDQNGSKKDYSTNDVTAESYVDSTGCECDCCFCCNVSWPCLHRDPYTGKRDSSSCNGTVLRDVCCFWCTNRNRDNCAIL